MKISHLIPAALVLSVVCSRGQLPPSTLQPGKPAGQVPKTAIADLPPEATTGVAVKLTAQEQAQGWKLLFDGVRGPGLRGVQKADPLSAGWKIAGGQLILPKEIRDTDKMTGGDLITAEQFWDFEFVFEWKASASANSGIRYMLTETPGQTPVGLEYQIIDDVHNSEGLKGGPLRRTGAVDNVLPVGPNAKLRTADPLNNMVDPWNEGKIVVQGTHVEHWLNGEKVLEFQLGPQLRQLAEKNNMKVPVSFGMKKQTRICILDQGTEVAFRNLRIRPIIPQAVLSPLGGGAARPAGGAPNPLLLPGSGSR